MLRILLGAVFSLVLIMSCTLTKLESAEIHYGLEIPPGSQVRMYPMPDQHLLWLARVYEPITVAGIDFPQDTWIEFSKDGKLKSAVLSSMTEIQNVLFDEAADLIFHEETGNLAQAALIQDTHLNDGICLQAGSEVFFRPGGNVNYAVVMQPHVIHGERVESHSKIDFTGEGAIRAVTPIRKP